MPDCKYTLPALLCLAFAGSACGENTGDVSQAAPQPAAAQTHRAQGRAAPKAPDSDNGLTVTQAWARASAGANGAAYFTLKNSGPADDTLLRAAADTGVRAVELHSHIDDGGVMRMRPVDSVPVPAGETITFAPRGLHVMLIGLDAPLKAGDRLPLILTFSKAGERQVTAEILPLGAEGPAAISSDHDHQN